MKKRSSHYSKASLMCMTKAFCDQWDKTMVVCDERGMLRSVVKKEGADYGVLMIGDFDQRLYMINDLNLSTTENSIHSCFTINSALNYAEVPTYTTSYCGTVPLHKIFPRGTRDAKSFQATDEDLSDRINAGLARYEEALLSGVKKYNYRTTCPFRKWSCHTSADTLITE